MNNNLRFIPAGVLAGSLLVVFEFWNVEITIIHLLRAFVEFAGAVIVFSGIFKGIVSLAEEQKTIKGIVLESLVIVLVVFVLSFLVKVR